MKTTLIKQNMKFLMEKFPDFYNNLTNPNFSIQELSIRDTDKANNYILTYNDVKCSLHSVYNVNREMERLFKPLTGEENQVIVIFGLGYGHCLDYIRKNRIRYKKIVIFEPCTNILHEVLKKRGVLELLGMENLFLHLLNLPNDMARYLLQEAMESKTVKILYHISYRALFSDIYDNVLRSFKNEKIGMESSINTMRTKSIEWNTQQLKSIQNSFSSASALAGKFNNVPAIIASAGPSLEKHFKLLEEIGDRALIVAPGSTTRIFNARGLNAHIAMSIDSNIIQSSFYKNFSLNSILLASYRLHPDTYKNFPNKIYCATLSTEYLTQYFYFWKEQEPFMIGDHASVSMAALDMLFIMGCNPIILVGQDLSYQDNRNYADDSANSISEKQFQRLIPDVDIYGNKVYTDYGYKAMQNDMETQNIKYGKNVKILNATEGGLNIHGIENIKFVEVYNKYIKDRENDVAERLHKITANENASDITDINGTGDKTINDFFSHLVDKCTEIEKMLNEKEAAFIPMVKLIGRGVSNNRLNNEMRNIHDFNKKLDDIPFFKQVVYPNIETTLAYFRAGGKYISDEGQDWEGAATYEHKLDEIALDFINIFKVLILREMISEYSDQDSLENSPVLV